MSESLITEYIDKCAEILDDTIEILKRQKTIDDTLAIVNNGNAYIETDFMLGGTKMQIETVFLIRPSDNNTGDLFIGHSQTNDAKDYRFFLFNNHTVFVDVGEGTNGLGSRQTIKPSENVWHKFLVPVAVDSSVALPQCDDAEFGSVSSNPITLTVEGFGTVSDKLKIFAKSTSANSQTGAIRYIRVRDFNTQEILADFYPMIDNNVPGIYDVISNKFYASSTGTLQVVSWKSISTDEGWNQ